MKQIDLFRTLLYLSLMTMGISSCVVIPRCPDQELPIIEVQINNTASSHDDYINTSDYIPCRARIINYVRFGEELFPEGVEIEIRNIPLSTDLTISSTSSGGSGAIFLTLPEDGEWLDFYIKGNSTSAVDKSAIIELSTAGAACDETVLSRTALMVTTDPPPIPTTEDRPRVEIKIGSLSHLDDYVTWAPTSCKIRWVDASSTKATINVTLQNMSGTDRLRFANTGLSAGTTATEPTIDITLSGDGSWVQFYIAGNYSNSSLNDKDAVIEVLETSSGNLLSRVAGMVRIRKNVNSLTETERDRYLRALMSVHETFNYYILLRDSHARDAAGAYSIIAARQAHRGSAFLPWHRTFVLHLERLIQSNDPGVAIPYWHFDGSSPNMFNADFIGAKTTTDWVSLSTTNPISAWEIPGEDIGIERRTSYEDDGTPGVFTEISTFGLGDSYIDFKDMETTTHDGAHGSSGNINSWIRSLTTAPQDPLFFLLHCNVDRLWAKWQGVYDRFDPLLDETYDLQGSYDSPPAGLEPEFEMIGSSIVTNRTLGQYLNDPLWPWDGSTGTGGTGTDDRPTIAPLTPFPMTLWGGPIFSSPTVRQTIDFRLLKFGYDDFFPY